MLSVRGTLDWYLYHWLFIFVSRFQWLILQLLAGVIFGGITHFRNGMLWTPQRRWNLGNERMSWLQWKNWTYTGWPYVFHLTYRRQPCELSNPFSKLLRSVTSIFLIHFTLAKAKLFSLLDLSNPSSQLQHMLV